ncbi:MAG: hypothetical protein RSB22_01010, partial [Acinetobacter sp.]
ALGQPKDTKPTLGVFMNLRSTLIGVLYVFSLPTHSCKAICLRYAPKKCWYIDNEITLHYFSTL